MKVDIILVFPSDLQARSFIVCEKIICYGFSTKKNMLRCLCTKEQAEAAINRYKATLLDVQPVLTGAGTAREEMVLFG